MGWGLKIKIFKIMGVHWKIQFLGGWGGGVATKKGLRQFTDLTGGWQKRGGWCFWGGWYPNAYFGNSCAFTWIVLMVENLV